MVKEKKYPKAIYNWLEDERPRERLFKFGAELEGTLTKSIVHPREVIKEAIAESSTALILSHNHPSGEPQPSQDDIEITNRIISACDLVGIKVLDHIIIGDNTYFSFFDEGLIKEE